MNISNEFLTNSLEHRFAGNGWAVVEICEDEWLRIASFFQDKQGNWKAASQFFLVWKKCLSLEKLRVNKGTVEQPEWITTDENIPIHHTLLPKIEDIRAKLASGEYVVRNTRLEKVAA